MLLGRLESELDESFRCRNGREGGASPSGYAGTGGSGPYCDASERDEEDLRSAGPDEPSEGGREDGAGECAIRPAPMPMPGRCGEGPVSE